jgi:hypothetical protein
MVIDTWSSGTIMTAAVMLDPVLHLTCQGIERVRKTSIGQWQETRLPNAWPVATA